MSRQDSDTIYDDSGIKQRLTALESRPDIFEACLDIRSNSARVQYIHNVTASGFDIATNYSPELKGVWYRAAILKSN